MFLQLSMFLAPHAQADPAPPAKPTSAEVLAQATEADWEQIPAEDLLVMRVADREVVMELSPAFAPKNVQNLLTLVDQRYFDGLAVVRSHDNYVVQWADPAEAPQGSRSLGAAKETVKGEFDRPARKHAMTPLAATDAYADQVGVVDGMPVASDGRRIWLTHCYGMVGVARGNEPDSGNGSSLYVVTGHAPRHLDRNITLVGRVIDGIEVLSAMPRGTGPLGFYESPDQYHLIESVRRVSELPQADRPRWYRLRTDTPTFHALVESKRSRQEDWFLHDAGRIGLCNVPLPRSETPGG